MEKFGLYVALQAKPGKEDEVEQFLRNATPLVKDEPGTISWHAVRRLGGATFGILIPSRMRRGGRHIYPAKSRRRYLSRHPNCS